VAANKTRETTASVSTVLNAIDEPRKRADEPTVAAMMKKAAGHRPRMWCSSIAGYGSYHYGYDSGREGDCMAAGISPAKQARAVCSKPECGGFESLLDRPGRFETGKFCLYINRLQDVDEIVLQRPTEKSVEVMRANYDTR